MIAWIAPEDREHRPMEPISVFLKALNRDAAFDDLNGKLLHCLSCGLPVCSLASKVVYIVDNPGIPLEMMTGYGYVEVRCKRCKQPYRIFV